MEPAPVARWTPLARARYVGRFLAWTIAGWVAVQRALTVVVLASTGAARLIPGALLAPSVYLAAGLFLLGWIAGPRAPGPFLPGPRRARRAIGVLAVALPWSFLAVYTFTQWGPNDWDVLTIHGRSELTLDRLHPLRPPIRVRTNALGFRGPEFEAVPPAGTVRVAVVGDSFVFGSGIDQGDGLIDRQLAARLQATAPATRWEVLNFGVPGRTFLSEVELAEQVLERAAPRVIVIGRTPPSRWDLADEQQLYQRFPKALFPLLIAFQVPIVVHDLTVLDTLTHLQAGAVPRSARAEEALERLVRAAGAKGAHVVRWSYDGTKPGEAAPASPWFRDATWPPGFDPDWGNNPRYAIPGDYHPTAAANEVMAGVLAPLIRDLAGEGAGAP